LAGGPEIEIAWHDLVNRLAALLGKSDLISLNEARLDPTVQSNVGFVDALPVVANLGAVMKLGVASTGPICTRIDRLQSQFRWRQNTNYSGADFLDGYAYCELVGPLGHLRHPDVALGLLLLDAHVTYPEHAHPAAEIYAVVAGHAEWRQGDRVWRVREPGERIQHASMEPHAMRTAEQPLLAAYLWQDHLHEGARLLRES
jgi:hypothetical protein